MDKTMENIVKLFRKRLFLAYWNWVETNKDAIGEKPYAFLHKQERKAEDECDTAVKLIAISLWMLNMISNFGVLAGIGLNKVNLQHIHERIDEQSTRRLLVLMSSCLALQGLPKDIINDPIRLITAKKFSLSLWVEEEMGDT